MTELHDRCRRFSVKTQRLLVYGYRSIHKLYYWKPRKSHLLELPCEIRIRIWQYVLSGHYIAFHDDKLRLTYGILDEAHMKTPGRLLPYSSRDIEEEILYVTGRPLDKSSKPYGVRHFPHKIQLTALIKTCRLIHSEAIEFLYTSNTFVFLQNPTLEAFFKATARHQFHKIRSIHIHWQIRKGYRSSSDWIPPWQLEPCRLNAAAIIADMPHLDRLSVYIQGLFDMTVYNQLLKGMTSGLARPSFFVARVTRVSPPQHPLYHHRVVWLHHVLSATGEYGTLRLMQPDIDLTRRWTSEDDDDFNACVWPQWRLGALFEPEEGGGDGIRTTSYAVCTPLCHPGYFRRRPVGWAAG